MGENCHAWKNSDLLKVAGGGGGELITWREGLLQQSSQKSFSCYNKR